MASHGNLGLEGVPDDLDEMLWYDNYKKEVAQKTDIMILIY